MRTARLLAAPLILLWACSDTTSPGTGDASARADSSAPRDASTADAGPALDAAPTDAAPTDAAPTDAAPVTADAGLATDATATDAQPLDSGASCAHPVGERFSAGDTCNFCECQADGTTVCTTRVCHDSVGGCEYDGVAHAYGERFPAVGGCNTCVCAASGLACTTRNDCTDVPDSAILLESPDTPCGADPTFTPAQVLSTLPVTDLTAPFLYDRARPANLYPERLPDTDVRVRFVYDGGFQVCRLPSADQPALDIQIAVEWITADGALNEGFPAYLRRNGFGFLDAWLMSAGLPLGGLEGTYRPNCNLDPGGYAFSAQIEPDGHATGALHRVCESDLSLVVGTFERPAGP